MSEKFYLTTPIYYVNARPHIGHAYTTIVADVLARRHRLLGEDTFFLTGTDEHGQKIERSAAAAGIAPQQFADQVSRSFEDLWKRMGITNDAYIRTTDEKHKRGVQKLFAKLYERGFIYLASYTGQYCVSDEAFVDVAPGEPCPDCGRITETVTEENFFFKLSEYQEPLLNLIESNQLIITPTSSRNEVLSFLRGNPSDAYFDAIFNRSEAEEGIGKHELAVRNGFLKRSSPSVDFPKGAWYVPGTLKDLSVSRSSFAWGIPVPEPAASAAEQKHVIYVWLDALANYMTAIGYGSDDPAEQAKFEKFWPADLHLVGKEITRFHCVYWPAFLLALNPAFPAELGDKGIIDVKSAFAPLHLQKSKADPQPLSAEQHSSWAAEFLPRQVTAHGWLLFDNSKMSKSKGNIVRTETILEGFGEHVYAKQFPESSKQERDLFASDVLRYFLLREIPFGQDGSFSFEAMWDRYNAELTNGYGNFVSRSLSMIEKYRQSEIPPKFESETLNVLQSHLSDLQSNYWKLIDQFEFAKATEIVRQIIFTVNVYVTAQSPWRLAKCDEGQPAEIISQVLYVAAEAIRIVTAALYIFLPFATARVWAQLGLGDIELAARNGELNNLEWGGLKPGTKLGTLAPIFPRADKGLAQIMTDMENPAPQEISAEHPSTIDPAAPPRTTSLPEPNDNLPVGGSTATTTHTEPTLSHTEATPSAPFDTAASQTPISVGPDSKNPADASPQITIDDFAKIELRVAQILVAERIPKADKLLRLEVDLGYERRQILSGIAEWYAPEDLVGRRIVVITNLAPRKMRGLESHGMLLAASNGEGGKPVLATFGEDIALGSRLK